MLSEITKDRLKATGYFTGVMVTMYGLGGVILADTIRAVVKSYFNNPNPLPIIDQLPIDRSLRQRILIVVGGVTILWNLAKFVTPFLMDACRLSHINLKSWRWFYIKS